jgi:hypothetical protein
MEGLIAAHVTRPLGPDPLADMMLSQRHRHVPDTTSVSIALMQLFPGIRPGTIYRPSLLVSA